MTEAVFTHWDDLQQVGITTSVDGCRYQLRYQDGQSFYTSDDYPLPRLTGKHEQPAGHQLKMPEVGDSVLIELASSGQIIHWGYMRHYLDLVERRYGTSFLTAVS